ncbi:TetR/AcrR family transcriptional regulator [Streptomyces anandii]|uniref:TetR/AcrR family transcriptional regulator n=1 Tax=Streptomyces anandii TaxID=285454 RepID=UPI0019C875F6|nr:TetR/AcrR family transcriptional regulator C-terminal domain-containing protein [Streptomyces anandii]GGY12936.1 TetR family transcriptional regulator [Streptomyces anandii JCM 4720]
MRRGGPLTCLLRAAVAFADGRGIEALSMRNLAQELGVVPMALYKHVAGKEQLLEGMVDVVVGEIDSPVGAGDWKAAVRQRILSARQALLRHPWASRVMESRTRPTPAVLDYLNSLIGMFRSGGGLSADLAHHVMHALGSRVWGFTPDLFPAPPDSTPGAREDALPETAAKYPYIVEIATARPHHSATTVGQGCDDQFEFEFALDLLLDGCERLHHQGWTSAGRS